jgi:hypothetical protein
MPTKKSRAQDGRRRCRPPALDYIEFIAERAFPIVEKATLRRLRCRECDRQRPEFRKNIAN